MCTTDGTLVQSVKVKVCIGTDARCSNLVRSVHDLCSAKKCRQKSFGHPILAEQVATERCGMYLRGGASRQSQWWPQAAGAGGSVSISAEWSCGVLSGDFQGRRRSVELDFYWRVREFYFYFCISGFCQILKDINVGI